MSEARRRPTPPGAREVIVEADLDAAPETVWRALTEPDRLAAWLAPREVGADVNPLAVDPGRSVTYDWREAGDGGAARRSTVTFTLEAAEGGGARLRIVHSAPLAPAASRLTLSLSRPGARPRAASARARPTGLRWAA